MKSLIAFVARTTVLMTFVASIAVGSAVLVRAQEDNTRVNQADRNGSEPTADQQNNNRSDLDVAKSIRKSIMDDKSLSTYAHNVKVIVQSGRVTLRGPVRSEEEKKTIESKATDVAGASNVNNEITIQPEQK